MPGIDGFAVCKEIEGRSFYTQHPGTGHDRLSERRETSIVILQAGAEIWLEKPIDTGRLLDLLQLEHRQVLPTRTANFPSASKHTTRRCWHRAYPAKR